MPSGDIFDGPRAPNKVVAVAREAAVVLGSNGSGESTLVDALVRTIYGFNRREPDARRAQEHRRSWKGGRFRARVTLEDGGTQLREVQRRLNALPRPEESSLALEARRQTMEEDFQAARGEARAYRLAYELFVDVYEEFRATDQERLVEHIDARLAALGGGELGPLAVPDDLSSAVLMYAGRTVPLASPPLSYGELHVALFAIRIGSADFLSGLGVRTPLLVDDPFVHLDPRRAGEIWEVLCRVARERQVLVTTQDRLTLEHLGVRPDLNLDGPEREVSAQMELPVAGPRSS